MKQSKTIKELRRKIFQLTKKCQSLAKSVIVHSDLNEYAMTYAKMILKKRSLYNEKKKIMTLNINYMSTKAYNFMRGIYHSHCRTKITLLRWRSIRYVSPVMDEKVLNNFPKKILRNEYRKTHMPIDF